MCSQNMLGLVDFHCALTPTPRASSELAIFVVFAAGYLPDSKPFNQSSAFAG